MAPKAIKKGFENRTRRTTLVMRIVRLSEAAFRFRCPLEGACSEIDSFGTFG
jgi:hypothetical protein